MNQCWHLFCFLVHVAWSRVWASAAFPLYPVIQLPLPSPPLAFLPWLLQPLPLLGFILPISASGLLLPESLVSPTLPLIAT